MELSGLKVKNQDLSFGLGKFYMSFQYESGENKEINTCMSLAFLGEVLSGDINVGGSCQCIETLSQDT